jgi:hypothetical protein
MNRGRKSVLGCEGLRATPGALQDRAGDAERPGGVTLREVGGAGELFTSDVSRPASEAAAFLPGSGQSGVYAFHDSGSLKLGDRGEQVQLQPAGRPSSCRSLRSGW